MIDPRWSRMAAVYSGAATLKVALFVGAFFGGAALDRRLDTAPCFLILGLLVAMGLGTWYLIFITQRKL